MPIHFEYHSRTLHDKKRRHGIDLPVRTKLLEYIINILDRRGLSDELLWFARNLLSKRAGRSLDAFIDGLIPEPPKRAKGEEGAWVKPHYRRQYIISGEYDSLNPRDIRKIARFVDQLCRIEHKSAPRTMEQACTRQIRELKRLFGYTDTDIQIILLLFCMETVASFDNLLETHTHGGSFYTQVAIMAGLQSAQVRHEPRAR